MVGFATFILAILLLVAPARFMTEDDAKYLGIGTNVFAGNGPTTVFGVFFPYHSPVWPIILVGPRILFGLDAAWWGHVLAIASACGIVALTAYFGSRIWALVGIAAGYPRRLPVLPEPGTGTGLDLPAAFLSLAYLAIGLTAVRRRFLRWAVAAGAVFAVAFLIKEIALPVRAGALPRRSRPGRADPHYRPPRSRDDACGGGRDELVVRRLRAGDGHGLPARHTCLDARPDQG